jgi:hypothetical protein
VRYPSDRLQPQYRAKAREKLRQFVRAAKDRPCADCGGVFHYAVMQFDHVRGAKEFNLSEVRRKTPSLRRVQEEIEKCDVVCANCHALRTWKRAQRED